MGQPVVHWEIAAKDAKQAQQFYVKLFDWTVDVQQPMNYRLVETGGEGGIDGGSTGRRTAGRPPSRSTSRGTISRLRSPKPRAWAARR